MAFASPNYPVLADVGIDIKYNQQALIMPAQAPEFKLTELRQVPIGVLKLFPGIQFELFEQIVSEKLSGVVLETFGEGNIPSNNRTLVSSIRRAAVDETDTGRESESVEHVVLLLAVSRGFEFDRATVRCMVLPRDAAHGRRRPEGRLSGGCGIRTRVAKCARFTVGSVRLLRQSTKR